MSLSPASPSIGPSLAVCQERANGPAPALTRRMMAFMYEGVLLFGLVMAVGGVYSVAINQRHALYGREGMMATLFLALALYFIWFWTHGGQTLAMRSWSVKLVADSGHPVSPMRALARFLASWLWFMPAWGGAWLAGWHQSRLLYGAMGVWILIYMGLTWLLPHRQFLHDTLCRTRVIDTRP